MKKLVISLVILVIVLGLGILAHTTNFTEIIKKMHGG
jgi:hypothetical protein